MTEDALGAAKTEGNFIELVDKTSMHFNFPSLGVGESLDVDFMGAATVPSSAGNRCNPLPRAQGAFPLRHVRDYRDRLPEAWARHGGVLLPMHDLQALFLSFKVYGDAQYAVRIGSGKLCVLTGRPWSEGLLGERGEGQDYILPHRQKRLDGFCYSKTLVRQFVAVPLGSGETVEERLSGRAEHGGMQLQVYPMAKERYQAMEARRQRAFLKSMSESMKARLAAWEEEVESDYDALDAGDPGIHFIGKLPLREGVEQASPGQAVAKKAVRQEPEQMVGTNEFSVDTNAKEGGGTIICMKRNDRLSPAPEPRPGDRRYQEMGLMAGGKIRQGIMRDRYSAKDYDSEASLRVFVHILNSAEWQYVTGEALPELKL